MRWTQHDPHHGRCFNPQRLHADKAYDVPHLRRWLWGKHIGVRIAREGTESSQRLGRRRWVIERTLSWLTGYHKLSPRYERQPANHLAFPGLTATLHCYKRLLRFTTQDNVSVPANGMQFDPAEHRPATRHAQPVPVKHREWKDSELTEPLAAGVE
ncbi:hypothetical protein FHS40_009007 [Streptomyces spectabilis]|uniref:Transposase DDE domain-containing protein n=1 Tax=Streptomyces spectabilis TaxID=68270 RepID=A0A7W8B4R7_STRST|nr:hypothetical protein [Streptomyces spectabilis]